MKTSSIEYTIRHAQEPLGEPSANSIHSMWNDAEIAEISCFQRRGSSFRPQSQVRLLYDGNFLAVLFSVQDHYVRAVAKQWNDSVCRDSCVEFFVAPSDKPNKDDYFNFEINCGGTMLLYRCPGSAGGKRGHVSADEGAEIRISTTMPKIVEPEIQTPTDWRVEYHVPWSLFHKHFGIEIPQSGTSWRGNFYKCGDATSHPHWASWAPLDTFEGGFHQPKYFQPLHFNA